MKSSASRREQMPRSASSLETRMPSCTDAGFLLASTGPFSGSESRPTVFSAGCPENGRAGRLPSGLSAYLSEGRRSPCSLEGCPRRSLDGRSPRSAEGRPPGPDDACSPRRLGGRSPHSVSGLSRRPVEARSRCSEGVRSSHRLGGRSPRGSNGRSFLPFPVGCSERPAGALSPERFSPSGEDEGLGRRCVEAVAP